MKGFIYLIEIAVVAILMTIVLSLFFSTRIKQDWERPDLISAGNNILNSIKNNNNSIFNILDENLTDIELNKPENIRYGLEILGSPRTKISIGCLVNCYYINSLLNPVPLYNSVFLNGRWINFDVQGFDLSTNISSYDAVILINYTGYSDSNFQNKIKDYLNRGGVVIGINDTLSNSNADFNTFFNLTPGSAGGTPALKFTFYDPYKDEIAKYFLGIGMDVYDNWMIWNDSLSVSYGNDYVNITSLLYPYNNRVFLYENSTFNLTSYIDNKLYFFKVKGIWNSTLKNRVDFQALNQTFIFYDFSEANIKTGANGMSIVTYANGLNLYDALTTNNSVVWISNFPYSDEYRALLKAAILSKTDIWTAKGVYTTREKTTVSSFTSLCCDMPETTELYLTMWYEV